MSGSNRATVALLTGNSLCYNPRALKEASALARAGYRVCVLGAWLDPALKARDLQLLATLPIEFVPVVDVTSPGPSDRMTHFADRAARKAARAVYGWTGWQSPLQFGPGSGAMLRQALDLDADLYIAHSEIGLYVGRQLLRQGCRVAVDMEDWFSEDLLPEARRHRPLELLRSLERELLTEGAFATCPSRVMATALNEAYGCRPVVIYNAFPWADRQSIDHTAQDRRNRQRPSIYWFSTMIGPGRGLETLIATLPLLDVEADLHLRGNPAAEFMNWLRSQIPDAWRDRVFIHGPATNEELLSRIAEHDIGFAGEIADCRSRELTVTNKILHYLLGGLAVVASATPGQCEIAAAAPGAVALYPPGDARGLAERLNVLLASPAARQRAQAAALAAAERQFCWEHQETALLEAVGDALGIVRPAPAFAAADG